MSSAELTARAAQRTPERVAQLGVEDKLPVCKPRPAVVREAVGADDVVTTEDQDGLTGISAGETLQSVRVPPDPVQRLALVPLTALAQT